MPEGHHESALTLDVFKCFMTLVPSKPRLPVLLLSDVTVSDTAEFSVPNKQTYCLSLGRMIVGQTE